MKTYIPAAGGMVYNHIHEALKMAASENDEVRFTINEIRLTVQPNSQITDICQIYDLKNELRREQLKNNGLKNPI